MEVTPQNYDEILQRLREELDQPVFGMKNFDVGDHPPPGRTFDPEAEPQHYRDLEGRFAWSHIEPEQPERMLDVGSYREILDFLLPRFTVATVDIRPRDPLHDNERVIVCDASHLTLPPDRFDVVMSLHSVEHFGLGRYGDVLDLDADTKALSEMRRVLKPGGLLVVTTHITKAGPNLWFNAHRNYSYEQLQDMFAGLECVDEQYFSKHTFDWLTYDEVTSDERYWDVYCGAWRKPKGE